MFERLESVRLGQFMERSGVLPTRTQFAYRTGPRIRDGLLCMSHKLKSALESGQEARIVLIDFRVNHQKIIKTRFCGYWRFCVVYIDKVSIKSITACYSGLLPE